MIYSWQLVAGLLLVDAVEMDMWCLVLCRQDHVCIIHRAGFHNGFAIFLHPNAEVFQQFSTNSGRCAFPGTSSVPTSWWNPELFTNGRLSPTGSQKRLVSNLKRTISNNIQQIGQLPLSQKIGYLQTHVSIVSSSPLNWPVWSIPRIGHPDPTISSALSCRGRSASKGAAAGSFTARGHAVAEPHGVLPCTGEIWTDFENVLRVSKYDIWWYVPYV